MRLYALESFLLLFAAECGYDMAVSAAPNVTTAPGTTQVSSSFGPTEHPTTFPTKVPTTPHPTLVPTRTPTTNNPTLGPTEKPTISPSTTQPTFRPTMSPVTEAPTDNPSSGPSQSPTFIPTEAPTTKTPTSAPTESPTPSPTTTQPTLRPSLTPTTETPTHTPSREPSHNVVSWVHEGIVFRLHGLSALVGEGESEFKQEYKSFVENFYERRAVQTEIYTRVENIKIPTQKRRSLRGHSVKLIFSQFSSFREGPPDMSANKFIQEPFGTEESREEFSNILKSYDAFEGLHFVGHIEFRSSTNETTPDDLGSTGLTAPVNGRTNLLVILLPLLVVLCAVSVLGAVHIRKKKGKVRRRERDAKTSDSGTATSPGYAGSDESSEPDIHTFGGGDDNASAAPSQWQLSVIDGGDGISTVAGPSIMDLAGNSKSLSSYAFNDSTIKAHEESNGQSERPYLPRMLISGLSQSSFNLGVATTSEAFPYESSRRGTAIDRGDGGNGQRPALEESPNDVPSLAAFTFDDRSQEGTSTIKTYDYGSEWTYGSEQKSGRASPSRASFSEQSQSGFNFGDATLEASMYESSRRGPAGFDMDGIKEKPQVLREELLVVQTPPGRLGLVIDTVGGGPPVVRTVKEGSVLRGRVREGDRLLAVDDVNVVSMSTIRVTQLITEKSDQPTRKLSLLRSVPI